MIISDAEKRITATHEAGHALLTVLLPHADPIHKVTIIPRGRALGLTQQLPVDEKHHCSKEDLDDQIAMLMGSRNAEEITTVGMTTGAGNDLERATELARRMVCEWGMSEAVGPLTFGKKAARSSLAGTSRNTRTIVKTRPGGSTRRSSASSARTTSARTGSWSSTRRSW
jgi:cell division protease FtsH